MKQIELTQGLFAIIDEEDFNRVSEYKWHVDKRPNGRIYASTNIKTVKGRRPLYMHRFIAGIDSKDIDHRDRNGLNNRRSNLRPCTRGENLAAKIPKGSSSQYKGVSFDKSRNKWQVVLQKGNKVYYAGRYANEKEAALMYNKMAKVLHGEYAYLNKGV